MQVYLSLLHRNLTTARTKSTALPAKTIQHVLDGPQVLGSWRQRQRRFSHLKGFVEVGVGGLVVPLLCMENPALRVDLGLQDRRTGCSEAQDPWINGAPLSFRSCGALLDDPADDAAPQISTKHLVRRMR